MSKLLLIEEAIREEFQEKTRARWYARQGPIRALSDVELMKNYRINRTMLENLCEELIPLLPPHKNSRGIDPVRKILTALHFFGRGSYQGDVGKDEIAPMAQQTVSRVISEVTEALNNNNIVAKYIRFPQTREERNIIKRGFYELYGIPGVCGCIDGTHIAIVRPKDNEERFFNRKNYHSLNIQMVCDENFKILNVDARYGGATHDSFIWQNCALLPHLETITASGELAFLLGDSGYPLRKYLMTPVEGNPVESSPEWKYNNVQKQARATIERAFGILKGRWRCLLAARELHYDPEKAAKICIACVILHNICIEFNLQPIELSLEEIRTEAAMQPPVAPPVSSIVGLREGRRVRQDIINILNQN